MLENSSGQRREQEALWGHGLALKIHWARNSILTVSSVATKKLPLRRKVLRAHPPP